MTIPQNIRAVLNRLDAAGFEAYIVGGCVRDMLMGREPSDYDVTTSAAPEQTMAVFAGMHILTHGVKHGTVTVMAGGEPVEITTFRRDGEYLDSRHPENVYFDATLEQDLSRRDFTCNAMAYSPERGLVDIFGGREDIANGTIRAVGDPQERFTEDALRILRALRFSSVLGFDIEDDTAAAAEKCSALLENISGERIYAELCRLLRGKNCFDVLMKYPAIIERIVPGFLRMKGYDQHNSYHVYDLLEHTARVVINVPDKPYMRLAALMHDLGKPDCKKEGSDGTWHFGGHPERSVIIAEGVLDRLKCDNAAREKVLTVIKYHDIRFKPEERMLLRWLGRLGENTLYDIFDLQQADITAQNPDRFAPRMADLTAFREIIGRAVEQKRCCTVAALAVNGGDIIALGVPQGIRIGEVLSQLLGEVIDGSVENKKESLLERAKEII